MAEAGGRRVTGPGGDDGTGFVDPARGAAGRESQSEPLISP